MVSQREQTLRLNRLKHKVGIVESAPSTSPIQSQLETANLVTGAFEGEKLVVDGTTAASVSTGQLVFLNSSAQWTLAAANDTGVGENELLAIALSAKPHIGGVMTHGVIKLNTSYINGSSFTVGAQVFMHPSTAGSYTSTLPSTTGQIVRVVGYAVAADTLFFSPSPDYIEV